MIYFTSDWHLFHDREWIYKPRGFNSIEDMNKAIIDNACAVMTAEDDLYILGDIMLGDHTEEGIEMLSRIPGKLHIVRGNHDTDRRAALYEQLPNFAGDSKGHPFIVWGDHLDYKGYHIDLHHSFSECGNLECTSLKKTTLSFFGHSHQKTSFKNDMPWAYHVGVDSHDCKLVSIDDALADCEAKVNECIKYL